MTGYMRRSKLARLLAQHRTAEALRSADLEAIVDATREPRPCGCRWVPCDKHADVVLRLVPKDGGRDE